MGFSFLLLFYINEFAKFTRHLMKGIQRAVKSRGPKKVWEPVGKEIIVEILCTRLDLKR